MKIRHSIVMLINIFPYCHCMFMIAIKCPVNKFYLRHFHIEEKLQFVFDKCHTPKPYLFIYRRKTITTPIRTPTACLIIDYSVFKSVNVKSCIFCIWKRNIIHRHILPRRICDYIIYTGCDRIFPVDYSLNIRQSRYI